MIVFRFATYGNMKAKSLKALTNRTITPVLRLATKAELERFAMRDNSPMVELQRKWTR